MAKKKKEDIIPQFTPLARSLIIDSSHRSRTELFTRTKACDLFENVMEAGSVSQASRSLAYTDFDACIIGPSLSEPLVTEILSNLKPKSKAGDCAFIVIVKPDNDKDLQNLYPDAHFVFPLPPSTRMLFENIVKAILLAGRTSPWPGIKLSDDGCISLMENGIWRVMGEGDDMKVEADSRQLPADFVLTGDRESIVRFCEAIPKTPKDKIEKVILGLLTGSKASTDPFVPFFIAAIKEWRVDISFMSLKDATHELKEKLLGFSGEQEKTDSDEASPN